MPPKKVKMPQPFSESSKTPRSPAKKSNPSVEDYNCCCCDQPDSAGDMVQCDQCNVWTHFICAGVDSYIQHETYVCKTCAGKNICISSLSEANTATTVRFFDAKANMYSQQSRAQLATNTATIAPSSDIESTHNAAEIAATCGNLASMTISSNLQTLQPSSTPNTTAFANSAVSMSGLNAATASATGGNLFSATVPPETRVQDITTTATYAMGLPNLPPLSAVSTSNRDSQSITISAPKAPLASVVSIGSVSTPINAINAPSFVPTTNEYSTFRISSANININKKNNIQVLDTQPPRSIHSCSSRSSKRSATKRIQIELQKIEEERALREARENEEINQRKQRDADYLNKKYQVLSQVVDTSEDDDEGAAEVEHTTTLKANVGNWVNSVSTCNVLHSTLNGGAYHIASVPMTSQHHDVSGPCCSGAVEPTLSSHQRASSSVFLPTASRYQYSRAQNGLAITPLDPHQPPSILSKNAIPQVNFRLPSQATEPTVQSSQPLSHPYIGPNEPTSNHLTKNHLAARHLIRDLPTFDGNPADWPLFIASFNRSTELGGFSDEENLMRLHKSLKGDALEAVRSLIIQPHCVGRVIETLKMLYGRPELVINTLLRTINATAPPRADKLETIVTFAIAVQNLCATVEASGLVDHLNNPMLMQELVEKLPPALRLTWAIHKQTLSTCSLVYFSAWLYKMAEAANGVLVIATPTSAEEKKNRRKNWKDRGVVNAHYNEKELHNVKLKVCCICDGDCASVAECKQFRQLSRTIRWEEVKKHQLCRRCLKRHLNYRCKSEAVCGKNNCALRHHRLLHNDRKEVGPSSPNAGTVGLHSRNSVDTRSYGTDPVLFRIVPVFLYGKGVKIKTYALLDDGSSVTLMDEEIAKQLNVRGTPRPLCLKWTGNTSRYESRSEILDLQISSTNINAEKFPLTDVHTVENLCLPSQTLNPAELQKKFDYLKGLSIDPYSNATPRLLIGVNNSQIGLPLKSKEGGRQEPVATKTRLGWVVHGNCNEAARNNRHGDKTHSFHVCECIDANLSRLVKNYICDDNFGTSNSQKIIMSEDDVRALDLLTTRTVRKNGRFETTLLWRFDRIQMPNSYSMAKRRLACLQKRMERDKVLAETLNRKINEYVLKGYARKLTCQEIIEGQSQSWYLPIFPVENPNKPGKIRIVWDAAAAINGTSLNSVLLKGPDQLTPLTSVIYKFRQHNIAIGGDIMEMFHQIGIRKEDQNYQRFLWGCNEEGEPDTYVMTVMTFGATCSPCTAHFIKNTNAEHFAAEFPRATRSIKENHYVDDLMDSVSTEEEAIKLAQEVRHIHKRGGFHIRNWVSNSPNVLRALKSEPTDQVNMNINVELGTEKVLGMWWCTASDCFRFRVTANPKQREILFRLRRPTKREVLKVLMTIFDPLGLIACFLMYLKILLQEIWRSGTEWDDEIKEEEYHKWLIWVNHLPTVETVKIPRCYMTSTWGSEIQLHIFVDASENGFAAVAYVRNANNNVVENRLIGAKTRVAPLKSLSIPRLELQAALLGARFAKCITESHGIKFNRRYFWSDSKTVLCWLRSDHRKYRQYVACRVSEIMDLTEVADWRWIPTNKNVADEATKWRKPPGLKSNSQWFNGPAFLKLPPENWPQEMEVGSTTEELKTHFVGLHTLVRENIFRINEISTWTKLLRSTAYVFRFVHNSRSKKTQEKKSYGPLSCEELQKAENTLIREAQNSVFAEEISDLRANRYVEKTSPLFNMCPFLDENQIVRANGRNRFAREASTDLGLPIILPRSHPITLHIINDFHRRYKHQNDETVVNAMRTRFYIPQMRSALKAVRKNCQKCKNNRAQPRTPIMAQLPPARLASFCRPFSYVGIDYFGPMTVSVGRRTEKRWGVLLTCLTTRAVHVEVAHTLTADSCIICLRNFMARRGTPIEIHSDNGTNFHGAERELREALKTVQTGKIVEAVTTTTTKWKFIPPATPHMGGSWERLVRSIKTVLYATAPTRTPNDELLNSMLVEAENILNSRPLTYIPIAVENPEALTPNHFLLGSACGTKPLVELNDDGRVHRKNWLISQQFADRFWKRWVAEYLPTLTRRAKWCTPVKPLEVGDIVIVVDPNSPRNTWPKGRVVQVRLSNDGQIRSAFIQTQSGIYERPAVKLAVLDVAAPADISL